MLENVRWFGQSSILFLDKKIIYIDPWEIPQDQPKADLILITHAHFDHCNADDVQRLVKEGTTIVGGPPDCLEAVGFGKKGLVVRPNQTISPLGVNIQVLPAYNTHPGRVEFHPQKNNWVGYVLEVGGLKYYHAGDTDELPEMKNLSPRVAMVPVGGTYTMDPDEAVKAIQSIKPQFAAPIHYGKVPGVGTDANAERFIQGCEKIGVKASRLPAYARASR